MKVKVNENKMFFPHLDCAFFDVVYLCIDR